MKWFSLAAMLLLGIFAVSALADSPTNRVPMSEGIISPGEVAATPEMWFYQQYQRQYQDPQAMVRQRAEFSADQRLQRIESMRWYGMSNSRPRVATDPLHGDYSPSWTSNDLFHPYRWQTSGAGSVVVVPRR